MKQGPIEKVGRPRESNNVDNINITPAVGGNDPTYTVRRLMRDAPELVELVRTGELSPNAAANLSRIFWADPSDRKATGADSIATDSHRRRKLPPVVKTIQSHLTIQKT
jgi:hypothetical protein